MSWRLPPQTKGSPFRLLLWTAIAGLIFGLIAFGEVPEDLLRSGRNGLHPHKASGEIVLVKFDDASLRQVGRWPWPRRYFAQLNDIIDGAGAKSIFWDIVMDAPSDADDDKALAESFRRSGRVTMAVLPRSGPSEGSSRKLAPLSLFRDTTDLASIGVPYNWQNAAWRLPYAADLNGMVIPTFAAKLAGVSNRSTEDFYRPDYSIDPSSIPSISASDVVNRRFDPGFFKDRQVVLGIATETIGDEFFIPGTGRMGGAYMQIIGAETLKAGTPFYLGWMPAYALALAIAAFAAFRLHGLRQASLLGGAIVVTILGPAALEAQHIHLDVMPGLFVLVTVSIVFAWRGFRERGLTDAVSGLPNLSALRSNRAGKRRALIAARILNYEEILATLPPHSERQLVDQIVSRLRVGAAERQLYQGDGGIFAWFEDPDLPFANHLEALYSLFRNAARVAGRQIDLSISFGVEIGSNRSLANRLASALVSADEAAHDGLKWKYHDPETLENAAWRLSLLSQLDSAVDKGEIWVAYQPKLDLSTHVIVGAEALARWTHPEKGPIAATEFIAAAEQHDRIGKLTDFVLDHAIAAAVTLNKRTPGFTMAVNLSAKLLSDRGFLLRLSARLARHGLAPHLLTLELTETAELTANGTALDMLAALRELGVHISIDDYGTGLSTLDYLKKIPASEIKIDQSFVKGMLDNRGDRLMVQSTVSLAHSLGRRVVAEGVERREILDELIGMGCDVAQGYIIGRPMGIDSLTKRLVSGKKVQVA